ncbi:MAG TPA: hypothetical protein VLA53_05765 [Nitrosopumilaceae archaeon]|nr:hypothetical protein [Nitrosopumilaceae archaeon]
MTFSAIIEELQKELKSNIAQIRFLLTKSPGIAFTTMNEIATKVGKKYKMSLLLNFPQSGKIEDYEAYGTQDISMVIDMTRKVFPIKREMIKLKAKEIFGDIKVEDAYMYEGKEGVKVFLESGRIDILPHSLHVWCKFDRKVTEFCDWLLINCYKLNPGVSGARSEISS